jgi:integrase
MSKLSPKQVEFARHTDRRQEIPDGAGLYLVLQPKPSTVRSWAYRYRHSGKSYKLTLGTVAIAKPGFTPPEGSLTLAMARAAAAVEAEKREQGKNPAEERRPKPVNADSFEVLARKCFARATDKNGDPLRSAARQISDMERLAFSVLGDKPIASIKRSDVVGLLDDIEDEQGPVAADGILACLSKVMNWYSIRDDNYRSPLVKGMRRSNPSARARDRILTDDELRAIWLAAEKEGGTFARITQFLLLTAARRCEASGMLRDEVKEGVWTCPRERSKTKKPIKRPLSELAQDVLEKTPKITGDLVFTLDGKTPFDNFHLQKKEFDAACGVKNYWTHDLRRTARSLLARAGVQDTVAERCLAHVVKGVKGTYDRHDYMAEMALAYEKLAGLIQLIVYPQDNVTPMVAL